MGSIGSQNNAMDGNGLQGYGIDKVLYGELNPKESAGMLASSFLYRCPSGPQGPPGILGDEGDFATPHSASLAGSLS